MPGLRRRFRKFNEDDAEGITPVLEETAKVLVAPKVKSFRNPFFQPLLTPSSLPQDDAHSERNDITKDAALETSDKTEASNDVEWPDVRNPPPEDVSKDLTQARPMESKKPKKIPQLKANRLDDIRHNRAKELLLAVSKEKKVDPFVSQADHCDLKREFEAPTAMHEGVADIANEFSAWNPFETTFVNVSQRVDSPESSNGPAWAAFGSMAKQSDEFTSLISTDKLPPTVFDGGKVPSMDESSIRSQDEIDMPESLNIMNILEQPIEPADKSSHSDIVSVENDETHGDDKDSLTRSSDSSVTAKEFSRVDEGNAKSFTLGLETVHESSMNDDTSSSPASGPPSTKDRKSILYERTELLSAALQPSNSPKGVATERSSDFTDERLEVKEQSLTMKKIVAAQELVPESLAGDNSLCDTTSPVPPDDIETRMDIPSHGSKDSTEKRRESNIPTDVRIVDRDSSFQSVRHRVKQKNSIHFKVRPSPSSHNSLLDAESDVSDHVSGLYASASCDSTSHDGRMDIIIDTRSFQSGEVSTVTYPRASDDLDADSSKYSGGSNHDPSTSKYPRKKAKARPLGASAQEIKMLNKFLTVAGPKIQSPDLSMQEREEIYKNAIKAGLPELFVNKILDQTAGIIRWDEQSCGTLLTGESTDDSSRHQYSVHSTDSYSTRYTQDNESISYQSYSRRTQTPKEASGVYGCLGNLNNSFWSELERGLSGDDMMENISAALSESFDEISRRKKGRRRRRKTQVRV